ncbi:MAG: hypothetical protein ACE5JX_14360 [Acidobacteriota bacterium]
MTVTRYRSINEMPRPWREKDDPENLRAVAQMLAFYRSLVRSPLRRPGVQRFRTLQEANASRDDPYRCRGDSA